MAEESLVLTEVRGPVLLITINRPEARNSISKATAEAMAEALDRLDADRELVVGVITGAGKGFSAGMDLKGFASGEFPVAGDRGFGGIAVRSARKPLIAAIKDSPWPVGSRSPWPATSSSPRERPSSGFPRSASASSPVPGRCCGCPGGSASASRRCWPSPASPSAARKATASASSTGSPMPAAPSPRRSPWPRPSPPTPPWPWPPPRPSSSTGSPSPTPSSGSGSSSSSTRSSARRTPSKGRRPSPRSAGRTGRASSTRGAPPPEDPPGLGGAFGARLFSHSERRYSGLPAGRLSRHAENAGFEALLRRGPPPTVD